MMDGGHPHFYTVGPLPQIDLGFTQIPTYYLVISLTYCFSILWFYKRCETRNLPQRNAMDISLILLVFGFIGARLAHILFEEPSHYSENPAQIFSFWQGGFVFYGGALLGYFMAFLYARRLKITFWLWHDTLAPVLAFGYATGRLACFLTACCYGAVCDLPWAVATKQVDIESGVVSTLLRHPTQLYASFIEYGILAFLLWYEKRKPPLGQAFLLWVILHGLNRLIMEAFRVDPRGPSILSFSVSAIVSLVIIVSAGSVLWRRRSNAA